MQHQHQNQSNLTPPRWSEVQPSRNKASQNGEASCSEGIICILLANQVFAESLCQRLNAQGNLCVVVDPIDPEKFLHENRQKFSLAVLDPCLSNQGELSFADLLASLKIPYLLIDNVVRSMHLAKALKHNARGYLTYKCSLGSMLETISKLSQGELPQRWCAEAAKMIDNSGSKPKVIAENSLSSLTPRQLEVLTHLAEGKTVKEVAHILHLSHKSVDSHKYRIMNRLHVHDRVHLSRFAIREGLIEP